MHPRAIAASLLIIAAACAPADDGRPPIAADAAQGLSSDTGDLPERARLAGICLTERLEGEACPRDDDLSCSGPLRCVQGVCREPALLGEPCDRTSQCRGGLVCQRLNAAGERLPTPSCQPALPSGAACEVGDGICQAGLRCIVGWCGVASGPGQICRQSSDCTAALYCDF